MSIVEGGVAIVTNDKVHLVTAVNGGGFGGPI